MNADALKQVTKALRLRLEQAVGANKVFVGPLDDPDIHGHSLILFLYRIMPNASLRNREHSVRASAPPPPVTVYNNSLALDLYYLVTVGTTPQSGGDDGSEGDLLEKLGAAMQALQNDPEITGPGVNYETVHVSLDPLTTEESSRIWALFPTANYRTSVAYIASPVWIDTMLPATIGGRVVIDTLRAGVSIDSPAEVP
jgi:Pvc16 N-terminal domain